MTRFNRFAGIALLGISISAGLGYFLSGNNSPGKAVFKRPDSQINPLPEKSIKSVFRAPASVPVSAPKTQITHTKTGLSHPIWKEKIEKTLVTQGSGNLKKAEIQKVDSFNWKVGKVDVKVDSIIVKLEHVKGHRSSFRAIVDASNGKILQTWDHPVLDNFNPKTRYGVKVDPRYHND